MSSFKPHKIELNRDYPCPCCRRGHLQAITLTEALGCDRCREIFVLDRNGYLITPASRLYTYPCAWYWTGQRWRAYSLVWDSSPATGVILIFLGVVISLIALIALIFWLVKK